ncbi:nuclear transport factor 2 family protein [Nocardioides sp. zg-DK7169]|uniref:YybH family protein n=1 Tax=Nocardioides sp. zg-DK7169 TaxID=2736600 RepID=UPI0015559A41|nr:nuclear transport factor 2 family protein [Nocardioides sp. zg-DK7169]NPC95611.1 SnoaL-like domain-containing protein [Nocardioides sp. zg-DK7169]
MIASPERTPLDTATLMLDSLRDRSLEGVLDCFDEAEDTYVFVEGPRWTNKGGERIHQGWRDYFQAPIRLLDWRWTEGPAVFESGDLATVCGVIEYQFEGDGKPRPLPMRMTWVVRRREDRVWRIVHEHGSQPLEDPYGTGDWLVEPAQP